MKLINVKKKTKKTEYIIKRHIETNYPIIVADSTSKRLIEKRICEILNVRKCQDNSVMTYNEFIKEKGRGINIDKVIIDELDLFLDAIVEDALKVKVDVATMTIECKDYIENEDYAKNSINIRTANLIV